MPSEVAKSRGQVQPMRYVRDSLFLLQAAKVKPVSLALPTNDALPFALDFPIHCPICGRMPSFPKKNDLLGRKRGRLLPMHNR
jgi:hypothetical protein